VSDHPRARNTTGTRFKPELHEALAASRLRRHLSTVPSPSHLRSHGVIDLPLPWRIEAHEQLHQQGLHVRPQPAAAAPPRSVDPSRLHAPQERPVADVREGREGRGPGRTLRGDKTPRLSVVGFSNWEPAP
jgi:hypothetical protein